MLHEKTNKRAMAGIAGEGIAERYLEELGYKILDRNSRQKFGEIDILARDKKNILCFVEVKTILTSFSKFSGLEPEDNLTASKLHKMKKMAEWYANSHEKEVGKGGYRIDLVCVKLEGAGDSDFSKNTEIKLYTNLI
jgi:putative endonuclease